MLFTVPLAVSLALLGMGLGLRNTLPGINYAVTAAAVIAVASLALFAASQLAPARRARRSKRSAVPSTLGQDAD